MSMWWGDVSVTGPFTVKAMTLLPKVEAVSVYNIEKFNYCNQINLLSLF